MDTALGHQAGRRERLLCLEPQPLETEPEPASRRGEGPRAAWRPLSPHRRSRGLAAWRAPRRAADPARSKMSLPGPSRAQTSGDGRDDTHTAQAVTRRHGANKVARCGGHGGLSKALRRRDTGAPAPENRKGRARGQAWHWATRGEHGPLPGALEVVASERSRAERRRRGEDGQAGPRGCRLSHRR